MTVKQADNKQGPNIRRSKQPDPPGRHAWNNMKKTNDRADDAKDLSHEMLKRMLSLSVPPNREEQFQSIFDQVVTRGSPRDPCCPRISRTKIDEINECYSKLYEDAGAILQPTSIESIAIAMEENDKALSSFVFHAVINRKAKQPKRFNNGHHFDETIRYVSCEKKHMAMKYDRFFTTVILFIPRASSFVLDILGQHGSLGLPRVTTWSKMD